MILKIKREHFWIHHKEQEEVVFGVYIVEGGQDVKMADYFGTQDEAKRFLEHFKIAQTMAQKNEVVHEEDFKPEIIEEAEINEQGRPGNDSDNDEIRALEVQIREN